VEVVVCSAERQAVPADDDAAVWEAIQTFENITRMIPDDVDALAPLALAYEHVGDGVRARETVMRLARAHLARGEVQSAAEVVAAQLEKQPDDAEFLEMREQIASQPSGAPRQAVDRVGGDDARAVELRFDVRAELELAWSLLENGIVSQSQYESGINRLTENQVSGSGTESLAFLLELSHMEGVDLDAVLAAVAERSRTPYVEVTRHEIASEVLNLLPLPLMRRLCVVPFSQLDGEVMVALLNPMNQTLRQGLQSQMGRRVHFFLCSPEDLQQWLDKYEVRLKEG
jgi:hypothetical protein